MADNSRLPFIENELKKFNVTDSAIAELSNQYMPLVVNGIEDKDGLKAVNAARKIVKGYRIDVDKRRKELNADALEYQRRINGEARRITEMLEPIEAHLANEEKKVADELERIKREKEEAETIKLQTRIKNLIELEFKFDGVQYITDYLDTFSNERMHIATLHLKQMDDAAFAEFYDNAKHYHEFELAARAEKQAREEAERKALIEERARLDAIAKEQTEKEAALKAEAARIESLKQYEESKQAVIDSEIECKINGCEAPIHHQQPAPVIEQSQTIVQQGASMTEHEHGYHEGSLETLKIIYQLAKNLSKEELLVTLQEEITEREKA